jgi:hypothetical protein
MPNLDLRQATVLDLSPTHFCKGFCEVDVSGLAEWLHGPGVSAPWIVQEDTQQKPQRLLAEHCLEMAMLANPLVELALAALPVPCTAAEVVLSRMLPGQRHGMHADFQNTSWLTRVHIPVLTNLHAWHYFEDDPEGSFYMPRGFAYAFNAQRRHAFGNDGQTARVHLIFDAMRV